MADLNERTTPLIIPDKPVETMKIASDETALGYIIINVADFDKATMKPYKPTKGAE